MRVDNPTITKIANLTGNGIVQTSGGDGTLAANTTPTITKVTNLTSDGLLVTSGGDGTLGWDTAYAYVREKLAADRTYYVRADGNDSNTGLANTAGGAFLTLQKAANAMMGLDCNQKNVTVQIGDGTYTAGITLGPLLSPGIVTIQGNAATPTNVVISTTSASCITVRGNHHANAIVVKDMKLTVATSGNCLFVQTSTVSFTNLNFGAAAAYHISASNGSRLTCTGSYAISAGALVHINSEYFGLFVKAAASTVTITNTPNFSTAYAQAYSGFLIDANGTFSGSATGTRYLASYNGIIYTGGAGATYFPGNGSGSTAYGGQYN
jgi:hypothetical protein